ncbi:unnamed protein product [Protopolystoma xenopodis]|uniref:Coatomer WD associated region domain-containing protein n=1 Tax=Protopolystoma xenopodis TaxID=117903 RepID=A0A3S5A8Z6_9PLAT|nr:unnamed protein product [Protopolystoma xenopodis]
MLPYNLSFPLFETDHQGEVVSFSGSQVYCLTENQGIRTHSVSFSSAMCLYIEANRLDEARSLACLGVTDADLELMGQVALLRLHLQVAKYAYMVVRNIPLLDLIQQLEGSQ